MYTQGMEVVALHQRRLPRQGETIHLHIRLAAALIITATTLVLRLPSIPRKLCMS